MKRKNLSIKSAWAFGLMLLAVFFIGAPSYGAVDVYLEAGITTIPVGTYYPPSVIYPLGVPSEAITMWGYIQCPQPGGFANCPVLAPTPTWTPGPTITAMEGQTLNIHIANNLPATVAPVPGPGVYTEPTSVIINGQTPTLVAGTWPTWSDNSTGNRPAGDTTLRVRSFTTETAIGATSTYTWGPLKPGTYLYQSGTHPSVQVQMGLYGVLIVYPTGSLGAGHAGTAYGYAYHSELPLLFSEIDPELHYSVASGWYGTPPPPPPGVAIRGQRTSTVDYQPQYFLVNGKAYPNTAATMTPFNPNGVVPAPVIAVGQPTLLRFLNAGLREKTPTFVNQYMKLVAEDSNAFMYSNAGVPAPYSKQQYGLLLPAGKTIDAIWTPVALFAPLFDRSLNLSNGAASPGGMIVYLQSQTETIGVYRPGNETFYLRNSNTMGNADIRVQYGDPGDIPIVGDWDGGGIKTVGVYRNGEFYLRNSNNAGAADVVAQYGIPGDIPVVGDWTHKGYDSIGVYRPSNQRFYLRNSNTTGVADVVAQFGMPGDIPIVGDWTGQGHDTIGVYRPSNQTFYLRNSNTKGNADIRVQFGNSGDLPVVGDWDGDGVTTIGTFNNGVFSLKNSNTSGPADLIFDYGVPGDLPLAGIWTRTP